MKINKENSMLIDIQYVKSNRKNGTPDYLYLIWKDMDTNEKYMQAIKEPPVEIYFEKPEFRDHVYNKNYTTIDTVTKKVVRYENIIYAIAEDMGDIGKQKLRSCFETKNYQGLKEFYIYPYVYGADHDVRVWYRNKWMETFDNDRPKVLSKGFLDIEVDTFESPGFPDPAFDPIDLITFIDITHSKSYTFCLVDRECKPKDMTNMSYDERLKELERRSLYEERHRQEQYWMENQDELKEKISEKFDESYPNMEYNFYFYKDERKMLVHLFQLINILKLDFIGIWNISFDIPYMIERMKILGLDPTEVMCHPDFPVKQCYFKKDTINFAVKNKSDFFHLSSYTIFIDQMIVYAAIRKGQAELRSNKLTYIAEREIKDSKLDYSEEGNLKVLGYKNWLMYFLYNIKDVLLQKGIEERTTDIDTYYVTSYQNITPYEDEFKQTKKLRNVQYLFYLRNGLVPGENVNGFMYNYEVRESDDDDDDNEDDVKFEGALVGNPLLIDNFGVKMFGKSTNNIFAFNIDFDMSSFYPSTIFAMNIDPSTLIFKMILQPTQYDVRGGKLPFNGITDVQLVKENSDSFSGDVAKEVMDNFQTRDYISTAYKWMNLPSVNEVYNEMVKYLN
jgi:hypothetical protein